MAGPIFSTPKGVSPSRPKRRFSLAEANRALPLVRRIVADIVSGHKHVTTLHAKLESLTTGKEQASVQSELDKSVERLHGFVDELTEVGCEIKDYETGLIDFVGRHKGKDVCLCWKLGEENVNHWHDLQSGFAGRQPVATLEEGE
jgi:hypothetical protein